MKWGTLLEVEVEYSPDPPTVLLRCRDVGTGTLLHDVTRRLSDAILPGRYEFGIHDSVTSSLNRSTTWVDVRDMEIVLSGSEEVPAAALPARPATLMAVERAQASLDAGRHEEARAELERLVGKKVDLAPYLIGPFAGSTVPLARLALEATEGEARQRLRDDLVRLATAGVWTMQDPHLALSLLGATGYRERERETRVDVLLALGRAREACDLRASTEVLDFPEPDDAAARFSYARAALGELQPEVTERFLRPLLADPESLRVRIDALVLGVRTSLMRGREEEARDRLEQLRVIPEFDEEGLLDFPEVERFLGRWR